MLALIPQSSVLWWVIYSNNGLIKLNKKVACLKYMCPPVGAQPPSVTSTCRQILCMHMHRSTTVSRGEYS